MESNIYYCIMGKGGEVDEEADDWYNGQLECQIAMTVS